jgi:hypothetical protein
MMGSCAFATARWLVGAVETKNDDGRLLTLVHKGIHVFHIDAVAAKQMQYGVQSARRVRHFHGHHGIAAHGESMFLEGFLGFFVIAHDQAQNAEVRGIGQGQGPDADIGLGQNPGHFLQAAGPVLQKDGNLLGFMAFPLRCGLVAG